jgi:hypothetical protein
MAKVSKENTKKGGDFGKVVDRADELDGYAVNFVEFREDVDATPLLKGLPDDRCQWPHWGYVLKGSMTFRYADREEVYEAGEAFYTPPGHVPVKHQPGTQIVMFSPARGTPKDRERDDEKHEGAGGRLNRSASLTSRESLLGQQAVLHREEARSSAVRSIESAENVMSHGRGVCEHRRREKQNRT